MSIMEPRSDEWLAARQSAITATDIAPIMGLSKFRTPIDVWKSKTGRGEPTRVSAAMEWGTRLEPVILDRFAEEHGVVERFPLLPAIHTHDSVPLAKASLDGMLRLDDGTGQPVDAKTTAWGWDDDDIPADYLLQMQWQMGVTGTEVAWLAVLKAGREYGEVRMDFDPDLFADSLEFAQLFWREYVLNDKRPEATRDDDLNSVFTPEAGKGIDIDASLWLPYVSAREQFQRAKEWLDMMEKDVKLMVGDATEVTMNGVPVATWRSRKAAAGIDRKKLQAEYPDVYASVVKDGKESRTWLVK